MKLVLPLPPNFSNPRRQGSWRAKYGKLKQYFEQADNAQLVGQIPPPPPRPIQRASISAVMYVRRIMDHTNAMARMKWPEDWLVTRGYIVGDDPDHLTWEGIPEQVVDYRNPRVEFTVTPLE